MGNTYIANTLAVLVGHPCVRQNYIAGYHFSNLGAFPSRCHFSSFFHKMIKIDYFLNTFRASSLVLWPTFCSFGTSSSTAASHEIIFLAITWGHPSLFRKEFCAQFDLTICLKKSRMCSFLNTFWAFSLLLWLTSFSSC